VPQASANLHFKRPAGGQSDVVG